MYDVCTFRVYDPFVIEVMMEVANLGDGIRGVLISSMLDQMMSVLTFS